MAVEPTSQTWILKFKNHKTTVLLHVEPLQTIASVKNELLSALRQTDPDGINGKPLPSSADDIVLGKPVDLNHPTEGWQRIEDSGLDGEEKGKGKSSGKDSESLRAAGLRDGVILVFKWEDNPDHLPGEEESWDVVIPTYDELYPQDE